MTSTANGGNRTRLEHAGALTAAFAGTNGVFLMTPPNYDPEPGFPDTRANAHAIETAIAAARPGRVVFLSTVGAQVAEPNLLNNSKLTEEMLRAAPVSVAFLRAAWFMENAAWDVEAARSGVVPSFLQPLDHAIPMVATVDIGRTAAALLRESWSGVRVIEPRGPAPLFGRRYWPGFRGCPRPRSPDGAGPPARHGSSSSGRRA